MSQVKKILSLDGGGIKGVLATTILERVIQEFPDFLDDVDLFCGTSTGGLIALGLANHITVEKLSNIYLKEVQEVFQDNIWDDIKDLGNLRGAQYSTRGLARVLHRYLDNKTLGDLKEKVAIVSFDLYDENTESWKPKIWHNFPNEDVDFDEAAVNVGLYTAAAPTYFNTVNGMIDGGVVANNPSMIGLSQVLDKRNPEVPNLEDIKLLSIGTGFNPEGIEGDRLDWGLLQWSKHIVNLMLNGSSQVVDFQTRQILGDNYFRINSELPFDVKMDSISKISNLRELGNNLDLTNLFDWLKENWIDFKK